MTQKKHSDIADKLGLQRVILPVIISLAVAVWIFTKDINLNVLKEISFTWRSVFWLIVAFLLVVVRTFGYTMRIKVLTNNNLSWLQSLRVIMLWEFTSSITPSTVGGTGFAIIFVHKEGISVGRSTAVVLATSFLDELYFVIMLPILLIFVGGKSIFITTLQGSGIALLNNLVLIAIIGYIIILLWVLLIGYGLFINPKLIKTLIINIFRLPFIRRWEKSAAKAGNEIVESSDELKKESLAFWVKSLISTFITWTSRYWIVNAILLAFFSIHDNFLIFARQIVLWIMMIISPTPGGAGFAEVILGRYLSDLIPVDTLHAGGVALAMALLWRIISYYPFLIAGAFIVPGWLRKNFVKPVTEKE